MFSKSVLMKLSVFFLSDRGNSVNHEVEIQINNTMTMVKLVTMLMMILTSNYHDGIEHVECESQQNPESEGNINLSFSGYI